MVEWLKREQEVFSKEERKWDRGWCSSSFILYFTKKVKEPSRIGKKWLRERKTFRENEKEKSIK